MLHLRLPLLPPLLFSPWPSINKHSLWGNIKINSLGFLLVHLVMQFTSCPAENTPGQYHRPRTNPLGSVPSSPLHLPPPACFLPSGLRGTKHTPVPSVLPRNDTCWWHCPGTGTTQGAWLCPCYACRRLQIYIHIYTHIHLYVYIYLTLCEKWLAISFQCDVTEFRKFQTDLFSYISLYCSSPMSSEVAGNTSRRLL